MGQLGPLARLKPAAQLGPLARLRLAFLLLGVLLLVPLALLLAAANERLEAQRLLRHQVVAERIFDELERELTLLLESESQRPSSAYAQNTSVSAWAPFIVGYFTADSSGTRYVAEDQLEAVRRARLDRALGEWRSGLIVTPETAGQQEGPEPSFKTGTPTPSAGSADGETSAATSGHAGGIRRSIPGPGSPGPVSRRQEASMREQAAAARPPRSSPEVLRQLNRADEQRQQQSAPKAGDPLRDYGY
jgi:hypothetical protein